MDIALPPHRKARKSLTRQNSEMFGDGIFESGEFIFLIISSLNLKEVRRGGGTKSKC